MSLVTTIANERDLRLGWAAALFSASASALYTIAQVEPSAPAALFFSFVPGIAVILWLQRDASRTGIASVHDLGFFLWLTWPLLIRWYSWKTRGRSGWKLTLLLFALILSAHLSQLVTGACVGFVRHVM